MKPIGISYAIANTELGNLRRLYHTLIEEGIRNNIFQPNNQIINSNLSTMDEEVLSISSYKIHIHPKYVIPEERYKQRQSRYSKFIELLVRIFDDNNMDITPALGIDLLDTLTSTQQETLMEANHHLLLYTDDEFLSINLNDISISLIYHYTGQD